MAGRSQEFLHIPCASAVAGAGVWWHCRSSACLLLELTMLQARFWLINTSKLPYSLGNLEIRGLWVQKAEFLNSMPSHRGCGDPTDCVSISLAKKLSQPLPPFHWTLPKTPPRLFSINLFYCAPPLLLSFLQAFLKKTTKKNNSKAFSLLLSCFFHFLITPTSILSVVFRLG